MAKPRYKQRCAICKDKMVTIYSYKQFPKCMDCEMKEIDKPITDPKMKKLFDIPRELYEENYFLRNIKNSFIRFGNLSEKQIEAFKKSVKEMKSKQKESEE
tara:strand:+ start:61669 stop:61971 length:303 start_codon:yes stop_codon:yes gene_type:complete